MENVVLNPMIGKNAVTRLSKETRSLAGRYLTGKYQHRLKDAGFRLVDLNLPADCPPEIEHGKNTILTAEKSSIDILPEERLAGSASNIQALWHCIPGYLPQRKWSARGHSISHTTVDFGDAVRKGLKGLETEILNRMKGDGDPHHQDFFSGAS